jgi:uncharacterized protein YmfQ (DUF2313 family)
MAVPPQFGNLDYQQAMQRLMPKGRAWRSDAASNLSATLLALSPTYTRSTAAAAQVLVDANPDTTVNLLPEWEESLRLPDPCTPLNPTLQQRQAAVAAKFGARGGLSIAYFVNVAAALGSTITITEFTPFCADMVCDQPDYDPPWAFAWQVNAPDVTTFYFSADQSAADEPLQTWDSAELICRITREAPAETTVIFVTS